MSITNTVFFATESERLAARKAFKRRLIELRRDEARIADLRSRIVPVDAELDAATNAHGKATAPIQAELAETEQRIMERLVNREPADAADESNRAKLLAAIEAENVTLEKAAEDHRARVAVLNREIAAIQKTLDPAVQEIFLTGDRLGNPHLLDKQWAISEGLKYAHARVKAAQQRVFQNRDIIERDGDRVDPIIHRRLRRWSLELEAAQDAVEALRAESAANYQALVDE